MSSLAKQPVENNRPATQTLQISAAIANHPPPRSSSQGVANTAATGSPTQDSVTPMAESSSSKKLPPSPLVTPPMNPSHAAQEAISPRSLLPEGAIGLPGQASTTATVLHSPSSSKSTTTATTKGVPHVYHDYAKLSGPGPAFIRKKTGGVTQPFPDKLHEMLTKESSDDPSSAIVSWLPHGRAFIVRKPKEFTNNIMPKYFRQTKLTSFQRQLNLYGFRRITQGADSGAYYHPLFLQGRPSLSQRMVRQKVKGTGHKQPSDASSEPNFYAMAPVEPEYPATAAAVVAPQWGARYKPTIMPPLEAPPLVQPTTATTTTQGTNHRLVNGIDPDSPGLSSLQGAAQLLRGISEGGRGATFLGAPAMGGRATTATTSGISTTIPSYLGSSNQTAASFLNPSQLKHTEV